MYYQLGLTRLVLPKKLKKVKAYSVTDLIYRAVQVLRENLYWIRISAQDTGLMEPVELQDKGQLSHMTGHEPRTGHTHVLDLLTQYIGYIRTSEYNNYYYREELCI